MALNSGDILGPYQILSPLGAGGMGEVYKALDTRLDRSVAVKVLPDHIGQREDARARFEREARAVASLNHPNICTLFDIGPNYMVMELIEGETLAARIAKGPVPLDQALSLATQIADALDRAHRAGVTHRDVKPQNIMITRDGVKVLDFGLAKSSNAKPGATDATLTAEGTVMGTPQYMAPEQFDGKEADARSDIWAFGAVVYEMVAGRKAFEGASYSSLVGAILSAEVKPLTPAWLDRLVRRCLQKDPDDRWQSMRDIALELKSPPPASEPEAMQPQSNRWPWAVAAVLLMAAAAGWLRNSGSAAALPVATEINPPEGGRFASLANAGGSAISPDGRTLAFVAANDKGEMLLYVRTLESLAARALAGTEGGARPFWSPDGKSLGFFGQDKLKRIDLAGGTPITLCDAGYAGGGDWNEAGVILFGTNPTVGIQMVPASGGTPALLTRVDKAGGENAHYYPQFLPGGREFLYLVRHGDPAKMGIAIGSVDTKPGGEAKPAVIVAQTEYGARYDAASGMLLSLQGQGRLMARKLELNPARLTGDPVLVAEGVRISSSTGYADFTLSRQGTLLYGQGMGISKARFGWRDRSGKPLETIGEPVEARFSFSLSPDGASVAYYAGQLLTQSDVWVMELARGLSTRISFNKGTSPRWSPDGRFIYYNNGVGIHRKPADGSGEETLLTKGAFNDFVSSVSPDGKALLFGFADIMKLALSGEAKPEPYLKTSSNERGGAFSPDGRWVAYHSNESGRHEIYIQGYPDKRGKWLVSVEGGQFPVWRADGKELYWGAPDGMVMAAETGLSADSVHPGRPQALFRLPVFFDGPFLQPSRDGQRFLVYEPVGGAQRELPMVLVLNWAARLGK